MQLLIGSFALTIASFVGATVLSAHRAHGIQTAAHSIATNALPSVACYSRTRTDIRQVQMMLERLTGAVVSNRPEISPAALGRHRDSLARDWETCIALPRYPEEQVAQQEITAYGRELGSSIDGVLRKLDEGDRAGASRTLYLETEPAIDRFDQELVDVIDLNVRQSALRGAEIAKLRSTAQRTLTFMMCLSTALAATAAFMMVRVLRHFTTLMESRVSEMEQFAGRVAHDIRSPLSAVGIALELTKHNPELGLEKGVVDRATRTVQRIGQLVDGLLVHARAGAGSPEGSEAEAAGVVEGGAEEMRPLADESGIELTLDRPLSSARIACSPGVLISIVSNLVGNAIKHMGSSPLRQVTIGTRDRNGLVRFEVRDTGPGIPPALGARIFDPYVRAAASATPGLGLGLATVRRLVETHGGSVGVVPSTELGSTFWFELPKAEATEPRGHAKRFAWPFRRARTGSPA